MAFSRNGALPPERDCLDLYARAARQRCDRDRRARRWRCAFERFRVDLVDRGEVAHVDQEDRRLHHVGEREAGGGEHCGDVRHDAARLLGGIALDELLRERVEPDLARREHVRARRDGLRVGPDRGRRRGGVDRLARARAWRVVWHAFSSRTGTSVRDTGTRTPPEASIGHGQHVRRPSAPAFRRRAGTCPAARRSGLERMAPHRFIDRTEHQRLRRRSRRGGRDALYRPNRRHRAAPDRDRMIPADSDASFRAAFDRVAAWIDDYYRDPGRYPVLSRGRAGDLVAALPDQAPADGEPFERIFADFEQLIVPGITHWNHPRFFAYFAISAARVTVLAEALAAALDVNAMLWRTSPAATELEDVTLGWLRRMLGLPGTFHGIVYDTASIGGFTALAAARESLGLDVRARGMAGRADLPTLRVYVTEHTHSHIEKGAIALGVGSDNVVKTPVDDAFARRPDALARAIDDDRALGRRPMCAVATVGTTSTTSSDPVAAVRTVTRERGVWLHVDAAD